MSLRSAHPWLRRVRRLRRADLRSNGRNQGFSHQRILPIHGRHHMARREQPLSMPCPRQMAVSCPAALLPIALD